MSGEFIGIATPENGWGQTPANNFAHFSEGPNYQEVNRSLLTRTFGLVPDRKFTMADVCMGHGMAARLAKEIFKGTNRRLRLIGSDLDPYAIARAKAEIHSSPEVSVEFGQMDARDLGDLLDGEPIEVASILDALHEIRDDKAKAEIVKSMANALKPESYLVYNSAFTTAAVATSGRGWGLWKLTAFKMLEASRCSDVEAMPIHLPSYYRGLIEDTGLQVVHEDIVPVPLSKYELVSIAEYPSFAKGFFKDANTSRPVELPEAVNVLKESLDVILKRLNTDSLVRQWHEIIAQKPAA